MRALYIFLLSLAVVSCGTEARQKDSTPAAGEPEVNAQAEKGSFPFLEGDIIFHTSGSGQSKAIQIATGSKYSHVGVIYESDGEWRVLEAVQPVSSSLLKDFIARGTKGHYVVKRLADRDRILTNSNLEKLKKEGFQHIGKSYDVYFNWSDEQLYCSELVYKMYKNAAGIELGELKKLKDFNHDDPLVKATLKKRYKNKIPLEEPMISPASIFEDADLVTVEEVK